MAFRAGYAHRVGEFALAGGYTGERGGDVPQCPGVFDVAGLVILELARQLISAGEYLLSCARHQ
jgi:hypothetical protein